MYVETFYVSKFHGNIVNRSGYILKV